MIILLPFGLVTLDPITPDPQLGNHCIIYVAGLSNGFYQIPVAEEKVQYLPLK